jgi:uncharacterized protein YecE (DUF72 family)
MSTIYAGTSGWSYTSWRPRFYPAKLASARFLNHYATRLNTVESNYTFRSVPSEKSLAGWIAATPESFRFAVKAHQSITHIKRLRDAQYSVEEFVQSIEPLREAGRLGPILFQLPPNFKADATRLSDFLGILPSSFRAAIEFRHESWFTDDVFRLLREANVALCHAESEDLVTPDVHTADFSYVRLRKQEYSPKTRKQIVDRVTALAGRGDTFVYFKHEDSPDGAIYAEELLKAAS